jgi:hypothetical protein
MRIGDLVKSKFEPGSLGLIIELMNYVHLERECARVIWVSDEVEPMYTAVEQRTDLEVVCK